MVQTETQSNRLAAKPRDREPLLPVAGGDAAGDPRLARRTRVLIVSPTLAGGGAERFTSTLLCGLDTQRFAPALCLFRDDITYRLPEHVPVTILDKMRTWHVARTPGRIRRLIRQTRPDVVLSVVGAANRFVGMALGGLRDRPPWIARLANNPVYDGGTISRWLDRRTLPKADAVVANSRGCAATFVDGHPSIAGRVHAIGNPTDFDYIDHRAAEPSLHRPQPGVPMVVSVGRLHPHKRPDALLDAFASLRRRVVAELWLCGAGPLGGSLAAEVTARGLTGAVRFLGFCENPYAIMRQAAVFAMTSEYEGLPNALIEAQALGLPAVATDCPHGPSEIIEDGQTGILVACGDAARFTEALEELLCDPRRAAAMGRAAAERARRLFDSRSLVRRWEELLAEHATT